MVETLPLKCHECGCSTHKLVPHPQDFEQKVMVCVDCEYAITCTLEEEEPIKNYADRRGV